MKLNNFRQKLFQPLPKGFGLLVRLTEIVLLGIILYIALVLVNEFIINPACRSASRLSR